MSSQNKARDRFSENVEHVKQTPEEFRQRIIMFKEQLSNKPSSDNDLQRSRKNTL